MILKTRPSIPVLILMICVLAAGCGGRDDQATTADTPAAGEATGAAADTNSDFVPDWSARLTTNEEAKFEAYWPSGCAKIRSRTMPSKTDPDRIIAVDVVCNRNLSEENGCKVSVYFETPDGGMASPGHVTRSIARTVAKLGLEILEQTPIESHGMQGVAAFCRESEGRRLVWMEGYLDKGRILQTMAWGPDGRIYEDEEIVRFMRSVKFVE